MSKLFTTIGFFLAVMLVVTGCSLFSSSNMADDPAAEMDSMAADAEPIPAGEASHSYGIAEFPESLGVPTVDVEIFQDSGTGWNLHVITENFIFSPEHAGLEHYPGEGHCHLYIDGEKIARLYGPWYHISEPLDVGDHKVEVTLNTNDHNLYTYKGEIVEIQTVLTVDPE